MQQTVLYLMLGLTFTSFGSAQNSAQPSDGLGCPLTWELLVSDNCPRLANNTVAPPFPVDGVYIVLAQHGSGHTSWSPVVFLPISPDGRVKESCLGPEDAEPYTIHTPQAHRPQHAARLRSSLSALAQYGRTRPHMPRSTYVFPAPNGDLALICARDRWLIVNAQTKSRSASLNTVVSEAVFLDNSTEIVVIENSPTSPISRRRQADMCRVAKYDSGGALVSSTRWDSSRAAYLFASPSESYIHVLLDAPASDTARLHTIASNDLSVLFTMPVPKGPCYYATDGSLIIIDPPRKASLHAYSVDSTGTPTPIWERCFDGYQVASVAVHASGTLVAAQIAIDAAGPDTSGYRLSLLSGIDGSTLESFSAPVHDRGICFAGNSLFVGWDGTALMVPRTERIALYDCTRYVKGDK